MFRNLYEKANKKIKSLNIIDLKLMAWGCIFLGGYLSLSIIPLQNIHNTFYLLAAILFFIKPTYKLFQDRKRK